MKSLLDPAHGRDVRFPDWCQVCCTRHPARSGCPGALEATGPERHGWKVIVETPHSVEAYGVLVAPAGKLWRARILTFPSSLWTVPGGGGTLKFAGKSPQLVEQQAIRFIEDYCARQHFTPRHGLELAQPGSPGSRTPAPSKHAAAPRWQLVLPVRYQMRGHDSLALHGVTRNISPGGLFIQTPAPVTRGRELSLQIRLPGDSVGLNGAVAWSREDPRVGRPPGMGIRLVMPPDAYLEYIKNLPPPGPLDD
jgi:uncharacterized protein (TIGR02266 family)